MNMNLGISPRRPAADASGPASDLTMQAHFWIEGPAEFAIDAAYAWGDDGEGWEGTCTLLSMNVNGRAVSRHWLTDVFGEPAVANIEDRAWSAFVEAQE
jgi:hypothetical protein